MRTVGASPSPHVSAAGRILGYTSYFIGDDPRKWVKSVPVYSAVRYENLYPGIALVYHSRQQELEYDYNIAPRANPAHIVLHFSGPERMNLNADGDLALFLDAGKVLLRKPQAYQTLHGRRVDVPVRYALRDSFEAGFEVGAYDHDKPLVIDPVLAYSTFLGGGGDSATSIAVASSGEVYVAGTTPSTQFPVTKGAFQTTIAEATCGSGNCLNVFVTHFNSSGTGLMYSTYLGGHSNNFATGIVADSSGNAYVTGETSASDFPTTSGVFQSTLKGSSNAFVTKIGPNGATLIYSTYLGGSGTDGANAIALDTSGNTFLAGFTDSPDFPTTPGVLQGTYGGNQDAFLAALNASGSGLLYATYLGGSGSDTAEGIAVDASDNAVVVGYTDSSNFPLASALQTAYGGGGDDAFVSKVNATGTTLLFSTYLGGSGTDQASAVALDTSGNVYVTGLTGSSNFPTVNPFQGSLAGGTDAFVSKLNAAGSALTFSTFIGGSADDLATAIALDSSGNVYCVGQTASADFPLASELESQPAPEEAFVTELGPSGSSLVFSTFLGGSSVQEANGIAIDPSSNLYVAGFTASQDFPATLGAFQTTLTSTSNAFVAMISPTNAPGFTLSPTSLTFGAQSIGTVSTAQTVTLRNMGSALLSLSGGAVTGDFALTDTCGTQVRGGSNCSISVTFSPTARGTRTGTLTLSDNATGSPQTLNLTGTGISPTATLSPSSMTFANDPLGVTSSSQAVTLTNSGTDPLTINGVNVSGDFAETNSCGTSLAAGGSCVINLTFTPTLAGTRTGTLAVTDDAPGSPQSVQLTGTGVGPGVKLSPVSVDFGQQPVGTNSGYQQVILTNDGNAALSLLSLTITSGFSQTNKCPASLPANGTCTYNVTFNPTVAGTIYGSLTISDNAPGSPHAVPLSGQAITGTAPEVWVSPPSLAFGLQPDTTTSSASSLTLKNTGNASLSITNIAIAGSFAETNTCGTSLAAQSSCSINVTFTPTLAGPQSNTLTITDNASGSPQSVSLSGTGTDFGLAVSPASVSLSGGQSAKYTLSISPVAGFNQTLQLSCGNLPQATTCTFNPASVSFTGNALATVAVTVQTTAESLSSPRHVSPQTDPRLPTGVLVSSRSFEGLLALALALLILTLVSGGRKRLLWGLLWLAVLTSSCVVGSQKITGTLPGTYTFSLTAATTGTTSLTHSVQASLTVK
jgi:hypothetical protein